MGHTQVYAATVLNFHPCAYDAYGMTIVEAASQGAPSVVAAGGGVGATDLLTADRGESFLVDFSAAPASLAEQVQPLKASAAELVLITTDSASCTYRGCRYCCSQFLVRCVR